MRARAALWPGLLATAVMLAPAGALGEEIRYVGHARDRDSGVALYDEEHVETWRDGRRVALTVVYRDPAGTAFAEKSVDFTRSRYAPDYRLEDRRSGRLEAAETLADGRRRLLFRSGANARTRERALPADPARVVDAGLEELFRDRLDALAAGEAAEIRLAIPSYLTVVGFRLRAIGAGRDRGQPTLTVRLEPRNPFFRLLAPDIDITFRGPRRAFWRYEGKTELRDPDGGNYDAIIEYPDRPH